jgi:hypothetical protein|tara:strand:+ start:9023 stop:9868 length:846 start_codon:yes stop_codon:yes gene_type:complete
MKRIIKITGMIMMIFVLSCEADDPMSFYGGGELVERVEEAWSVFRDGDFDSSLAIFNSALIDAEFIMLEDSNATLIRSTLGDIHTGIGWCNLRLLQAEKAREHFIISQGYELYSFGTSAGLMTAYYELAHRQDEGEDNGPDTTQINLAIDIGHWIFSSGMPEEFGYNATINVDDVRLLMGKSYYAKGDLSNNSDEESGALFWIFDLNRTLLEMGINPTGCTPDCLDPSYCLPDYSLYLGNSFNPNMWNLCGSGEQDYDSLDELILMILMVLEGKVFEVSPA